MKPEIELQRLQQHVKRLNWEIDMQFNLIKDRDETIKKRQIDYYVMSFLFLLVSNACAFFIYENIQLKAELSELDRCSDTLQQCFDTVEERKEQERIRNAFENTVKDTYHTGIGATIGGDDGQLQYYRDSEYCKNFEPKRSNLLDISFYGTSMLPAIRPQSDLYGVKPHWNKDLVEGDIVVLDTGDDMYLVHRVFSVYPEYFTTKGDNNLVADAEQWTTDNVKYVVCGAGY